jgi:hypothetical protein
MGLQSEQPSGGRRPGSWRWSRAGHDELRKTPFVPSRRFYKVEGSHTFRGARDGLMRDLDDALARILEARRKS